MNHIEYVVGFLFSPHRKLVVLIKKNKPDWQKGKLNGVGGKVEDNELPHLAMSREFKEETGLLIPEWRRVVIAANDDVIVHFFRSFDNVWGVETMTREVVNRYAVDRLPGICIHNLHWLIPLCLDDTIAEPVQVLWKSFEGSKQQVKEDGSK